MYVVPKLEFDIESPDWQTGSHNLYSLTRLSVEVVYIEDKYSIGQSREIAIFFYYLL